MDTVTVGMLAAHRFLHGMPAAQLSRLSTAAHYVERPAGHRFFEEGGRAERFWLLHTGVVALDLHVPGRAAVTVETIGRGAVLGWSWLFPPYEWRFGAVARQPVHAIEFDARAVRSVWAATPALHRELNDRFTQVILDRLQATRLRLLDVYAHPAGPRS